MSFAALFHKTTDNEDPLVKRERELRQLLNDDKADRIKRQDAREQYIRSIPPAMRQIVVLPTAAEVQTLSDQCSPLDPNDASARRLADEAKVRAQFMFPTHFSERERPGPTIPPRLDFDLPAARAALA